MAKKKVKSPSKIASLTSELRLKNESQNDINKSFNERLNQLEDLGLALSNLTRGLVNRIDSVNTKTLLPEKDTKDQKEESESSVLQKMYNFMVSSAEKREKKRQLLQSRKKEARKQKLMRMKKSFKMSVRKKLTPTTSGFLKTMGLGLLGFSIGSLAWMFQDELKASAEKFKNSMIGFGNFLSGKFQSLKTIFNSVKSIISSVMQQLQPVINWFKGTDMFKMIQEGMDSITNQNSGLIKQIDDKFEQFKDWIVGSFQPLFEFAKQTADDPLSFFKNFKGAIGLLALNLMGPTVGAAIGSAVGGGLGGLFGGGMGYIAPKLLAGKEIYEFAGQNIDQIVNRTRFGKDYVDKTEKYIMGLPDKIIADKFGVLSKTGYADYLARGLKKLGLNVEKLGLGVREFFGEEVKFSDEERKRLAHLIMSDPELEKRFMDPTWSGGVRDVEGYQQKVESGKRSNMGYSYVGSRKDRYETERDAADVETYKQFKNERNKTYADTMRDILQSGYPDKKFMVAYDANDGWGITDEKGNTISQDDIRYSLMSIKGQGISAIKKWWETDPTLNKFRQSAKTIKEDVENIRQQLKTISSPYMEDAKDIVSDAYASGKQTYSEIENAVQLERADDETVRDSVISGMNLSVKALEKTFNTTATLAGKASEKLKPTLERINQVDFQQEALDSYQVMQKVWEKVSGASQMFSDPSKIIEQLKSGVQTTDTKKTEDAQSTVPDQQTPNKIATEQINKPEIKPDPNEHALLKHIMEQSGVNMASSSTNILTNNGSTFEDTHFESPLSRNLNKSIRRSMLNNTSPLDLPFSMSR